MTGLGKNGIGRGLLIAALLAGATPVWCMQGGTQSFDMSAQPLKQALSTVARTAGVELIVPAELIEGRSAPALHGYHRAGEAIARLLEGSGLVVERVGEAFVIKRADHADGADAAVGSGAIVVTGTRIRGSAPVGASLLTLDREAIAASGHATVQEVLRSIPQNFGGGPGEGTAGVSVRDNAGFNTGYGSGINLRGLGSASTLVLLNGNRPPLGGFSGVFADLSLVPLTAVERIEVLADGASALYGSDAVAGVVNVIPRTRFDGAELTLRAGTADGDLGEQQAGAIVGTAWSGGRLVLAAEYLRRGNLAASQRAFATADLRRFGAPDHRLPFASPGTIIAGGRSFAIPAGQDGRGLAPEDLRPDEVNLADPWAEADILPAQERYGFYARGEQAVGSALVHVEMLWADRRFETRSTPTSLGPRLVTPDNPFYVDPLGTGQPVLVQYDFRRDLGPETQKGKVEAIGLAAGISLGSGPWSVDLDATYGRQKERSALLNIVNDARLALALADPHPASAYNLFGDGPSTNPATIDFIRGSSATFSRYRLWSVGGRADGPLLDIPGGALRAAIGGEYREESFSARALSDRSTPTPVETILDLPGTRRIAAMFGELLIPVVGDANRMPGIESLDISLAARIEDYSDFGTTTNPKIGLSWRPVRDVTLRATYGTSFRAPGFAELRQGPTNNLYFAIPLPDPAAPGGMANALVLRGNDPDIGPERATVWTAGVDLTPRFLPGTRLRATWFDVRYKDRITDPSAELFNMLRNRAVYAPLIDEAPSASDIAALYADPAFIDFFGIPASDVSVIIDARSQNLAVVHQSGIDFELSHAGRLLGGSYDAGLSGTWLTRMRRKITPTAPADDVLDTLGNPADLRLRGHVQWSKDGFGVAAYVNHVDGYTNRTQAMPERVGAWTTVDLQLSYAVPPGDEAGGMKVALSISNLFDRDPPFVHNFNGLTAIGYDPDQASPIGRMIAVQVTRTW